MLSKYFRPVTAVHSNKIGRAMLAIIAAFSLSLAA